MKIRRHAKNKSGLRRLVLPGLGLLTLLVGSLKAQADTHSYASERRQIKVCVLVTSAAPGTGGGPENVVPHTFYVMDRRSDLKPAGWEFVNPMASTTITGDIYTRWQTRGGVTDPAFANTPDGFAFRTGQPLTKNFGAYWEVNLDNVSTTDLQQFDVVLMAYHNGQTQFTSDEREKLRRYVDSGGTIWLEDEGGFDLKSGGNYGGGQFIVDLGFSTVIPTTALPIPASLHHPLINFPYPLSQNEVRSLGAAGVQYDNGTYIHHAHQGLNNTFTGVNGLANPRVLVPVIWAGTASGQLPYISAGDYGAGHIVVSSGGVATGINSYVGGVDVGEGGNSAVTSGEATLGARTTDLKFAYNLISWTSSVPTGGVNARRTNGTQENVGAQLGNRFSTIPPVLQTPPQSPNVSFGSGSIIHKGVVFYVDGANVLHAYDASPQQDLDGDGNSDDGIRDNILGAPYDEIWNVNLVGIRGTQTDTRVSTPTIASVVNPVTGVPQDILIVTTSIGSTIAFDAFPSSGGVLATTSPPVWGITSTDNTDLAGDLTALGNVLQSPGPAFSDGVVFTLWNQAGNDANHPWHIAAIDPLTGNEIFQESTNIGATVAPSTLSVGTLGGVVPGIANPIGSLTTGYVRDNATGALDKMIYVPTRTEQTTDTGGGTVQGVWFSTKGEPLEPANGATQVFSPKGTRAQVPWYLTAPPAGGVDLRPVLYKRTGAGVLTRLRYLTDFTVQYEGAPPSRRMVITINALVAPGDSFTADYTLDWPADPLPVVAGSGRPTAIEMRQFSHRSITITPDPRQGVANAPAMHILGSPALSPEDYLFVGAGDYPGGDRLYAFHEQFGNTINTSTGGTSQARSNTELAWMFYANAPDDDFNLGTGGVAGRFHNTDTFFPPKTSGLPGLPDMYVTDFEQIGSPAYSNGVVYVTGYCHLRTEQNSAAQTLPDGLVVMALRANPDTTFTVQRPDGTLVVLPNSNTKLKLRQPDLVNSTALSPKYIDLLEDVNFTVDRVSSTIHINNFRAAGGTGAGDAFNTALPIFVTTAANATIVGAENPIINNQTGYGILDNVLWWMTVPLTFNANVYSGFAYPSQWSGSNPGGAGGLKPASGPTIIGSTLYYGSTTGQVVSVDLTGINANGGQAPAYKDDGTSRIDAQAALKGPNGFAIQQPIFSPPVATAGIVSVGTSQGLSVLDNQLTLIADNNRLIEVDHAGRAAWTMDATQSLRIAQSQGAGGSQVASIKTSLSRPNMAHRSSLNDFLVADTGNNRVLQVDKGGIVTWELSRLSNDLRFLRENDPVVLNQPTDIQTYTTSGTSTLTFTSPVSNATYSYAPGAGGLWFAIHYIIADSGNFRALEVVDVYDANGNPVVMTGTDGTTPTMLRQVVFTTRSYAEQNKAFRYRTIQQFGNFESGLFRTYMVAAVDNVRQAANFDPTANNVGTSPNNVGGPGGSLLILKRYPPAGQGADGDTAALINSLVYANPAGTVVLQRQTINNPRWFKQFNVANPANLNQPFLHYALADANGVYILKPGTGALAGEAVIEWSLSSDDYYYMTGRRLNATSIQKLEQSDYDSGTNKFYPRYLITNGYTGRDNVYEIFGSPTNARDGEIHGEVIEVRSDYYTTRPGGYRNGNTRLYGLVGTVLVANPNAAITWIVPNETIPTVAAPGAIVRKIGIGTNGTSTGLLEQPTFSDRPF
jgi:hypothetical protein